MIFPKFSVDNIIFENDSMDFGFSLGVLHQVPDTQCGLKSCVDKSKLGSPFLIYLYYKLDNNPKWYRLFWKCSEIRRLLISKSPHNVRYKLSQFLAIFIYSPFLNLLIY